MINFVKAVYKDTEGFQALKRKIPRVSEANIKEGIWADQR
jgi:hypothetical protein